MNKQTMELLQFVVLCLSVGSTIFVTISWYNSTVRKQYAAQRDFEHLKRNYQQLADNQAQILKEMDSRFDMATLDLRDIKGLITSIVVKISTENTGGWMKRNE